MVSSYDLRITRSGTPYTPVSYSWAVTATDANDYMFTAQNNTTQTGTDISIAAQVGDNLVFNVDASYTTGAVSYTHLTLPTTPYV